MQRNAKRENTTTERCRVFESIELRHFVAAILTETTTDAVSNNKKNFNIPSTRDKFGAMSMTFFHRVVRGKESKLFTLCRICRCKIF